jgi:glucosyl-3-phosphoglycerate synthase
LFSLFYPELTQLLQPLAGEYAVRRGVLESIPFPIGYGVETSHLLDVYQRHGMRAFAQTDLDQRVHRNQSTGALGRMAFGIIQSFLSRLAAHGKLAGSADISNIYRAWQINGTGHKEVVEEIIEEERPPMLTLPEYRERHPAPPAVS